MKKLALIVILLLSFKNVYVQEFDVKKFDESLGHSGKYFDFFGKSFDQVKEELLEQQCKIDPVFSYVMHTHCDNVQKSYSIFRKFYSLVFSHAIIRAIQSRDPVKKIMNNYVSLIEEMTRKEVIYIMQLDLDPNDKTANEKLTKEESFFVATAMSAIVIRISLEMNKTMLHIASKL